MMNVARAERGVSRKFAVLYLENGIADRAQIWYVARDPSAELYPRTRWRGGGGTWTREHVPTPFLYLRNGWADWAQIWCVIDEPIS